MARRSIRSKNNGDEWEAFHRKARRMLRWRRGEIAGIKRRSWRRMRATLRSRGHSDNDWTAGSWESYL
jgi:hypothetical protein